MSKRLELILGAAAAALLLFLLAAYRQHIIDDARRDATVAAQEQVRKASQDAEAQIIQQLKSDLEALKQQKQVLAQQPAQAPTIIRETIPLSQPIQQTAPITKETLPDAPVAQLTSKQEQELASFGLSCKECALNLDAQKQVVAEKDKQITALETEVKAAKGGGFWTQLKRNTKWLAIGAGVGYALARR